MNIAVPVCKKFTDEACKSLFFVTSPFYNEKDVGGRKAKTTNSRL